METLIETKSMNVLLIDDDATFRFIAKTVSAKNGNVNIVNEAVNGLQALQIIKESLNKNEKVPDMILLDLNMPVMDGWEFLDALPEIANGKTMNLPIVIMSSSINVQDKEKSYHYPNVVAMYTKPITSAQLDEIRRLLIS